MRTNCRCNYRDRKRITGSKNDILTGKTRISRKHLREMASDSDEDIAKTASEIAEPSPVFGDG